MAIQPGVWGIDLGQCALKAVRLQEIDGQLTATAFDYVEHPKILSQPDADPDQLTREALEKFLSRNSLRGDIVAISVPGQSGLARFVKLPPVEEKKISDIVRFEAKQQIPFNLDEVVWDYQKIGSGVVTDGFAMETEIGLFAMKRDMVHRYLQHFKDVNVEVHVVQMAPLALCNFVAFDMLHKGAGENDGESAGKRQCVVALDIGADSSNLVITDGERVIWQRPIPLGGNHFTRALTKDLKLTFAKAEHLKRNATKSPDLKKILAALKPVLNDFVGEVQRSLGYFTNTHRDAHIQYMVGLGNAFRLPGLQRFLGEKLQLDVRKLGKLERLQGDTVVNAPIFQENILSFGVAYGLALQGLKRARLITNLLPQEIRTERLVRAKKPWAVAAAAALLLGTGAMAFSYFLEDRTYGSDVVAGPNGAMKKADTATKALKDAESQFNAAVEEAKKEKQAVESIVAGSQERLNWLELTKFINDCVPQPNGRHLPNTDKALAFWNDKQLKTSGKEAWNLYSSSKARGGRSVVPGLGDLPNQAPDELPTMIDDLIQFNVEGVSARYCDDLPTYWKAVQEIVKDDDFVRPRDLWKKPPADKAGWIIELRGYTFHSKAHYFVINALLESIARHGGLKEAPAGAADQPGAPAGQPAATPPAQDTPASSTSPPK